MRYQLIAPLLFLFYLRIMSKLSYKEVETSLETEIFRAKIIDDVREVSMHFYQFC